jgi:hypothetical protein
MLTSLAAYGPMVYAVRMDRQQLYRLWQQRAPLTPEQLAELFIDHRPLTPADVSAGQRVYRALKDRPPPGDVCDPLDHLDWVGSGLWTGRQCPHCS